jgi:cytochrome c peroxidase
VELGKELFFDPRLSRNGKMSCATCHKPERNWTDGLPRARGKDAQELTRNTPSLLTARDGRFFFWDGRASTLEEAALTAVQNPKEMNQDLKELVVRIKKIPGYRKKFESLKTEINAQTAAKAMAEFMLSIPVAEDSHFDRFLRTRSGLTPQELRGWLVFSGPGNCRTCHFSSNHLHNVGLKDRTPPDLGRYLIEPNQDNWKAFKTPSLRNIARTAPYMHDGSLATLRDVIEFYDRGGDEHRYKDANMQILRLTKDQKDDLEAFLNSFTSTVGKVEPPRLPPDE